MAKVVHVGAGSAGFGKNFLADFLTRPSLQDAVLCLMDINLDYLEMMHTAAQRIKAQLNSPVQIEATTDQRRALDGADYVIITIVSHGFEPRKLEHNIPKKYGVYPTSGCTSGPSGIFRGLRYIPVILDLARELKQLSPQALMLDYSNPSSIVPWALTEASPVPYLGLCHSVPGTAMEMARIAGIPYEETGHWAAGINHQAWMLRFEWKGKDVYPLIWEKMKDPEVYQSNVVKFELLKYFGCWVTESSVHNAEMDLVELRKTYPKLGLMGGMSKRNLSRDRGMIDAELEYKIPFMLPRGGFIPFCDHQVPPDVPWENFKHYRQKLNAMILGQA